ncbi:cyclin-dependent kinase [Fusarium heterosporum]|uniref:Cyclin-dependent kinase n=1 Tax=Fusarium heterosporum TaxID=42747 RepID=A0A8H5X0Q8_FUSHE|nr:hypothetical protein FGRMN_4994 [Fusarium graminum]KAF5677223.1 cyclin-dependent kinase [Fusarium heterosporum]
MTSPWKKQPEDVVDSVLKRAEVSKIARRLQNRLALAKFKTKHGWEDLTLDSIEPKVEEEMRRKRLAEPTDVLSDSSSSASDLPYPSRALMSSPLKAPLFSDAVGSSNGSTGHRKRTYLASFHDVSSSPSKRFRLSPTAHKSFDRNGVWKSSHQLARSSPLKPRRQQHFTTSGGPDVSFFQQRLMSRELTSPNFAAPSDDDDDLLPIHSFNPTNIRSSPPRTPPMRTRSISKRNKGEAGTGANGGKTGEEGADLLLYLAASPSPAVKKSIRTRMEPPSTPPQKSNKMDLPSSMMMTPGGGNLFPTTPSQAFDFADFVNITPSPAQKPFKTPVSITATRTPVSVTQRRLTFD